MATIWYDYTYQGVGAYSVLDKPLHDLMENFVPGPGDTTTAPVGIAQLDLEMTTFSLYPNPAMDHVSITLNNDGFTTAHIVDLNGRIVWEAQAHGNTLIIPLDNVESGIYIVQVRSDSSLMQQKLVVR